MKRQAKKRALHPTKTKTSPATKRTAKPQAPKTAKRATKRSAKQQTSKVAKRATKASSKPASKPASKPKKAVKKKDNRLHISVTIERDRMCIRWPTKMSSLTKQLTYSEDSVIGNLLGRVEELKDGVSKKLTPLNYINARQVLSFIKIYESTKDADGNSLFRVTISKDFIEWYKEEHRAKDLAKEAYKLLDYDEETIQTEFPFLKIPLYPWQTAAMEFTNVATRQGKGVFLCDETGLGKTYVAGAHLKSQGFKAVVLCPAGLREGWRRKLQHLTDLSICMIGSEYPIDAQKSDVIIMSYAMLKKRGVWPLSEIIEKEQRVLIMDEGHLAKNYDAKRTALALYLSVYARHTLVVTATPLKNRILELHPLLRATRRLWINCSQKDFVRMYDDEYGRGEVAEHLEGIMCRRMIKDVWKNPPTYELAAVPLPLSNEEDYRQAEKNFIEWLIRQGCSDEKIAAARRAETLVRLNKLRELAALGKIEEAAKIIKKTLDAGEQVVVFCTYNEPLRKLVKLFRNATGKNYKGQTWRGSDLIIGSTPLKKRMRLIDKFNAGRLGLLCLGLAGGLGIDLPISCYGYLLDLPWTPADIEQWTGRLVRIGQERDCQFIKCLAEGTIDQRMELIIRDKAQIFQEAIGDEDAVRRVTATNEMKQTVVAALIADYLRNPNLRA
jgi:SWI/SNF-related matrix-associated actin-dependent regulator 1 of chromatin subfamily A